LRSLYVSERVGASNWPEAAEEVRTTMPFKRTREDENEMGTEVEEQGRFAPNEEEAESEVEEQAARAGRRDDDDSEVEEQGHRPGR